MGVVMLSWTAFVILLFLINIFIDYLYLYFLSEDVCNIHDISLAFTYIEICQVLVLMIMIVYSTTSNIRKMNLLDNMPTQEKARLKLIMVAFGVGYFGDSAYLVTDALNITGCGLKHDCTSFFGLMLIYSVFLLFDVIPMAILYYQHS